jgi:hypothetical protein
VLAFRGGCGAETAIERRTESGERTAGFGGRCVGLGPGASCLKRWDQLGVILRLQVENGLPRDVKQARPHESLNLDC